MKIIRLECEAGEAGDSLKNEATGLAPVIYRGEDVRFDLLLLNNGTVQQDADLTSLNISILDDDLATIDSLVVSALTDCTAAAWRAGTGKLCAGTFTAAETVDFPDLCRARITGLHADGSTTIYADTAIDIR